MRVLLAPGIGPATWRRLREHIGSDEAIVKAGVDQLTQIDRIGRRTAGDLLQALDQARPDLERAAMQRAGATLILHGDEDYPPLLAAIPDPPVALWVRGRAPADLGPAIGIVGARRCTAYGREQAGRLAALLAQSGLVIVSGGALGIDGEAHRGALRVGGQTIVVLGSGLGHFYPREHHELFTRIIESGGALVSEHPTDTEPRREYFPRRNRIVSGLSLGVLVVEAGRRSGALITARLAAEEHGREVMAVPGRVDSPASRGCLELIRDGGAALVTDHVDVIMQLESAEHLVRAATAGSEEQPSTGGGALLSGSLTDTQAAILEMLRSRSEPAAPDEVAVAVQVPVQQVLAELTLMQIRGLVARDHRGVRLRRSGAASMGPGVEDDAEPATGR
ncbi:MAG: DNA-processing protein DprA [Planctomycetota bacterium]|jgi:DNA processing protein